VGVFPLAFIDPILWKPTPVAMLFSLNVGKVDAGVAVLLTEDMRVVRRLFTEVPTCPSD